MENKLISMVNFVNGKEQSRLEDEYFKEGFYSDCNARFLSQIFKFATFLNTPLNISMFVPAIEVGDKWEVLEEPKDYQLWLHNKDTFKGVTFTDFKLECIDYQTAKDNVIFEGFEYSDYILSRLKDGLVIGYVGKTIQDLIKYNPTLTIKGVEDSGLNR